MAQLHGTDYISGIRRDLPSIAHIRGKGAPKSTPNVFKLRLNSSDRMIME